MKRIQYFILLGAMLLASCNETTTPIEATDAVTISTEAVTESIYPDLGIYDYDGRTFTIAYALNQMGDAWPYEAQEEDGDIFNDALFRRDRNVEEKYNVDINWYDTNNQDVAGIMQKSMMAGDNDIDLGLGHMFMGITALLESAVQIISKEFTDTQLTVSRLARQLNVSEVYLRRLFAKHLGTSPKQHITAIRIDNAKALFKTTDCPVEEVSLLSGFSDPKNFAVAFKNSVGISPRAYKKKYSSYI